MANLKYGSSGNDVKTLQQKLIDNGYDVGSSGADGVFGKNTQNAVMKYQKDNGLTVDGIAGKNTLGALYGNSSSGSISTGGSAPAGSNTGTTSVDESVTDSGTASNGTNAPYTAPEFTLSDDFYTANDMLTQFGATKPGEYTPLYDEKANSYLSLYENRDPFSYDFNSDALYQQYKDQYIQQGQMAMMDTMGQAAAMTGGYGNSYAQSVGQQTYNQYLGQLNEIMPELYDRAYSRYYQEGQDMLNMYELYMNKEAQNRATYDANLDNWYREYDLLQGNVDSIYARDKDAYNIEQANSLNEYTAADEAEDERKEEEKTEKEKKRNEAISLLLSGVALSEEMIEIAGLTPDEVAAYQEMYNNGITSTGDGAENYIELSTNSIQYWHNRAENDLMSVKTSDEAVTAIEDLLRDMGYTGIPEKQAVELLGGYIAKLATKGLLPDYLMEEFGIEKPKSASTVGSSGGGGSGVMYSEAR